MNRGRSRRETDLDVTGRGLGLEVGSDGSESEVDHFEEMYVRFLTCSTVNNVEDEERSRWMGGEGREIYLVLLATCIDQQLIASSDPN